MNELILIADDEPKIVRLARDYLEKNGFRVISAYDGLEALAVARAEKPDLIVLDLMMPKMDGLDVCRTLRRESDVPIIMLTARAEESDQLIGLEIGADDYITKPFSPRALVARARAVLRRVRGGLLPENRITIGDLDIDVDKHEVSKAGAAIHLTRNEFKLLEFMARSPGQAFSREQLLEALHGYAYEPYDRSIDSHIKNLRRKLEQDSSNSSLIQTVYGIGYKLSVEEQI